MRRKFSKLICTIITVTMMVTSFNASVFADENDTKITDDVSFSEEKAGADDVEEEKMENISVEGISEEADNEIEDADIADVPEIDEELENDTLAEGECGTGTHWSLDDSGILFISGEANSAISDYSKVYALPWFNYLDDIKVVIVEQGITRIGNNAFLLCTNLEDIYLPDTLESIGLRAFSGCESVNEILLPGSLKSIEESAFDGCTSLSSVKTNSLTDWMAISFDDEKANPTYYTHKLVANGVILTSITVPNGVKVIKKYAFYGCSGIKNLTIGESVETIESNAFYGCTNLNQVIIPNAVANINGTPFMNCSSSLNILCVPFSKPNGWDSNWNVYSGTSRLATTWDYNVVDEAFWASVDKTQENIVIPDGVTKIPASSFSGCTILRV